MTQNKPSFLTAQNISVISRGTPILRGLDFQARAGEVTAIAGPSGAGKSTLLKVLSGDQAYGGQVLLNGQDLAGLSLATQARLRAVLPQATPLAFPFTVMEVVRLGTSLAVDPDHVALQALHLVGLAGYEARYYQQLSGGEQQRVQLARVLCQVWEPVQDASPRWLLLDEPVSSLDIGHQLQVMEILRDFAARGGGVVAVMHDLNLTAMSAANIALVLDGQMLVQGAPEEVFQDHHLSRAYGCNLRVGQVPATLPFVLPQTAADAGGAQARHA